MVISITKRVSLLFSEKSGNFRLALLLLNFLFYLITYSKRVYTFLIFPVLTEIS